MDELPEWTWPYFDNYTGPYWSDGRFQSSVKRGKAKPMTKLDVLSKKHDERYANNIGDNDELFLADLEYYKASRDMSFVPRVIGAMPLYGNYIFRQPSNKLRSKHLRGEKMRGARPTFTPAWDNVDGTPSLPPGAQPVKAPSDWWDRPKTTPTSTGEDTTAGPDVYDPAMWTGDSSVDTPVKTNETDSGALERAPDMASGQVYSFNPWTQTRNRRKKKKNKKLNYICI